MTAHLALASAINNIPDSWEVTRFRFVARLRTERNTQGTAPLLSLSAAHGIQERDEGGLGRQAPSDGSIPTYWLVHPGDIVVNPMWLIEGGIAASNMFGAVSPAYRVYTPSSNADTRYLHHLLRSQPYLEQYNQYIRGVTTFDRSVTKDDFHDLPVILPSLEEQRRIADFLDAETSRISHLSTLCSQQISRLTERQISHLSQLQVELAESYGSLRLRYAIFRIEQGWSPQCEDRIVQDGEWGVIKAGCVNGGIFDPYQHKTLPSDVPPRTEYQLRPGDLLMSRASGSSDLIGSVGIVPDLRMKLLLCDKVYRITPDPTRVTTSFLAHMLRTHRVREHIKMGISGAEGMANNLPVSTIKDCEIPAAPLEIQQKVSRILDEMIVSHRKLTCALEKQLSLLEERKRALITAAVTGQFDVSTASGRGIED